MSYRKPRRWIERMHMVMKSDTEDRIHYELVYDLGLERYLQVLPYLNRGEMPPRELQPDVGQSWHHSIGPINAAARMAWLCNEVVKRQGAAHG